MADIFQGLPVGPSTWTKDDGSLGRSFISGMEIGNQRRQQALREAEFQRQIDPNSPQNQLVAAQIIQDNIRSDLAKQQIAHSVSAEAYFANLAKNPPQPEELLNQAWTPTGNPMIDGPMEKMRNDAATKVLMKNNSVWRQQTILEGSKLLGANPNDYPDFMNSFDPNGNPTKATTDILTKNKDVISQWEQEQARLKPGVVAAETRGQYSIARQEMADEARAEINQSTLDWKSKHQFSRAMPFIEHAHLAEIKGDIANINTLNKELVSTQSKKRKDELTTSIQNEWIKYHNKWDPILSKAAQRADQADRSTAPTNSAVIPQGAIDKLKSNPDLRSDFDAKYGAGASDSILGK